MNSSYLSREELDAMGFKHVGENVMISRKASIYGASEMSFGDNVRVDDFCVLSGKIELGNYIHIAVYSAIFGGDAGVKMKDFTCLSSRCSVYAKSDDYSGEHMTNPMVDEKYLGVISERVELEKHVLIGTGSTILPGVVVGEGTSVGAMSLITKSLDPWGIYAGIPCRFIRERSKKLLELEKEFIG